MAEDVELQSGSGGRRIAVDRISESGVSRDYQLIQLVTGDDGLAKTLVTGSNGLPVTIPTGSMFSVSQLGQWSIRIQDGNGNILISSNSAPGGAEQALVVRNIPSGTQVVSGGVTALQNGTWNVGILGTALVSDRPATSGGLTMHKKISVASTNATNVKPSIGQVYGVQAISTNAAARYLKLYDKATAPVVGTDMPVKTLTIPGNASGAGLIPYWHMGLAFVNGIGYALTTGPLDTDTGAVAANEIVLGIDYF